MIKIYNDIELNFLISYFDNNEKSYRKNKDRSYEFVVFANEEYNIITKLLKWFEKESGEKLKNKKYYLFIHNYKVGDYFAKHIDDVNRNDKSRAYVVGFHLNNDYEGGDYKLYNPDFIIDKTPGVPYYFKSDRLHEINKISKGNRKSVLMFINYEDLIKKTTLI